MATQLVCLPPFRHATSKKLNHEVPDQENAASILQSRHRVNRHHLNKEKHVMLGCHLAGLEEISADGEIMRSRKAKLQRRKVQGGHWEQEPPRLGFCYLVSALSYILRKTKAFTKEDPWERNKTLQCQPYFSIPVVPSTAHFAA